MFVQEFSLECGQKSAKLNENSNVLTMVGLARHEMYVIRHLDQNSIIIWTFVTDDTVENCDS